MFILINLDFPKFCFQVSIKLIDKLKWKDNNNNNKSITKYLESGVIVLRNYVVASSRIENFNLTLELFERIQDIIFT